MMIVPRKLSDWWLQRISPFWRVSMFFVLGLVFLTFLEGGVLTIFRPNVHGLNGAYYANTDWQGTPSFTSLDTSISTRTLNIQRQKFPRNTFSVKWQGYLNISKAGLYTFVTNSDDGSWLSIDDALVVDNGGFHGLQKAEGKIALAKGLHKLTLRYVQIGGYAILEVLWAQAQGIKLPLPPELLLPLPVNPVTFRLYQMGQTMFPFCMIAWGLLFLGMGVKIYHARPAFSEAVLLKKLEQAGWHKTLAVVRCAWQYWAALLVMLSGMIFGLFWKLAQLTLIAPELKRLYPLHLYADSALRMTVFFVMLWLVLAYLAHRVLGIELRTALKVEAVGLVAMTLTLLGYYFFLDVRGVQPVLAKVYLLAKGSYVFFIPYRGWWAWIRRRQDYLVDMLSIVVLFSLIFFSWLPPEVDKFLYWRDGGSIIYSSHITTLMAMNGIRYFDIHLWDSYTNAGSTPITFWSTVQFHSLGLLDNLLGFTNFDPLDNHQLGNYFGYLFLALVLFSWVSVYLFLRAFGFSRFTAYFLGLAYPFIGSFQFVDFETQDVYQAWILPCLAFWTLRMLRTKTVSSVLWLSALTSILVHYTMQCSHPAFFSHTYLFLIGWMVMMIAACPGERFRYGTLLGIFLGSQALLFMPKLLAVAEFAPRLAQLKPHGFQGTLTNYHYFGSLFQNILRFFYFWAEPDAFQHARKWYYMLTPVTFLFIVGIYVIYRQRSSVKRDLRSLSVSYCLAYLICYFFFQVILEPSIIQAWLYKIHQILLLHYSFNAAPTFTLCFLVVAAIGMDWWLSEGEERPRAYIPVIIFNLSLIGIGLLFLRYPSKLGAQGLQWEEGMTIDSHLLGRMLFIIITTNMIIYLLRSFSGVPALRNLIVTVVFVIYLSHILEPHLKYAKFIDGTPDQECESALTPYAFYLKNQPHDVMTYQHFRERALRSFQGSMLERTAADDMSDAYFNEILLHPDVYAPACIPKLEDRLSLGYFLQLAPLERYHGATDYREYRYSATDLSLTTRAYAPFANSFPHWLFGWNAGFSLIPRELTVFNKDTYENVTGIGGRHQGSMLNLEYHSKHPAFMDILGIKYLYLSRQAFEEFHLQDDKRFELRWEDGKLMLLENTTARPLAYLASDYRVAGATQHVLTDAEYAALPEQEKKRYLARLPEIPLDAARLLLESDPGLPVAARQPAPTPPVPLPPVEFVNVRFNWAVFRVTGNPQQSLLFHSDSYDVGWQGFIDDKQVNIYRAQLAFKAVVVPPGDHLVWFEYRPGSFVYGVYIVCATIIGIVLLSIMGMRGGNANGVSGKIA